jgi:Right handed beta helix region
MPCRYSIAIFLAIAFNFFTTESHAVQRAHVSALAGSDANTASGCSVPAPCRTFQAAMSVVDPNGEVVALDSGGYGAVTITKSISLIAPTGVYAGISVFPGATGVLIPGGNVIVALRGITINGQGGRLGIDMAAEGSLSIENCVISNFNGLGFFAMRVRNFAGTRVSIVDAVLRNNFSGIFLGGQARVTIARTTIVGTDEGDGVTVYNAVSNTTTQASITDSVISHNRIGLISESASSTSAAVVSISETKVVNNLVGLAVFGSAATLKSLGNNTVDVNTSANSGTVVRVPLL